MMKVKLRKEILLEKQRKKQKRKRILTFMAAVLLLLVIAVLVVWKVYTVETVEVKGNVHYSEKEIKDMILNDEYAWNSLYVLLKYQFLETEEIPFIDTMEVTLKNPKTLQVQVYEKGILGYLYISTIDQNAYFDKDGFVVEISKEIIEGIPRVDGLDCDKVVLYETIPIKDEKILKSLLTATQALKKNEVIPEQIKFDKDGDITLNYGNIQVLLGGSENLTKKILRLQYILPELEGKTGTLHVENWTENTTDIIFNQSN